MKLLTKEMIESKKDLLLLELENMKKEKCPIKEREYFVQSFTLKK